MKIDREAVYKKYNGHCAYCGCDIKIKDMQVDHIYPTSRVIVKHDNLFGFGEKIDLNDVHELKNLNPSCRICNNFKNQYSLEDFREALEDRIRCLQAYSSAYRIALKYDLIQLTDKKVVFYFEKHIPASPHRITEELND